MARIRVLGYDSVAKRDANKNGRELGTANSYEEFTRLLKGNQAYGYFDENGNSLNYEQVQDRFGIPRHNYHMYEEE